MLPKIKLSTGTIATLDLRQMCIELWNPRLSVKHHWMTIHYCDEEEMIDDWEKIEDDVDPIAAGWEDGLQHIIGTPTGEPSFVFESCDENTGDTVEYDTLSDALKAAWDQWRYWTPKEKKNFTNPKIGGYTAIYMMVSDLESPIEILNFADVLKDQEAGIDVTFDSLMNKTISAIYHMQPKK